MNYIIRTDIVRSLGADSAVMYAVIENTFQLEKSMKQLYKDKRTKLSVNEIKEKLNFSDYQQRKIIDKLTKAGLIKCNLMGLPATRYFTLEG